MLNLATSQKGPKIKVNLQISWPHMSTYHQGSPRHFRYATTYECANMRFS